MAAARLACDLLLPWYLQAARDDRERIARWSATMTGDPPPPTPDHLTLSSVGLAARGDAVVWRGLARMLMGLRRPAEVYGDTEFETRVGLALRAAANGQPAPIPTRVELVAAVRR